MKTDRKLRAVQPNDPESNRARAKRLIKEWRRPDELPVVNTHTDGNRPAPSLDLDDTRQREILDGHLGKR